MDLRCDNKLHGVLITASTDEGVVEVKCQSRWCGAGRGVVVLHRFSTQSGKMMETRKYRQPEGGANGP
jgi:hypothetical protein